MTNNINKPATILAINPGARYTGFAIFHGPELWDWGVKTAKGKWSEGKAHKLKQTVEALISYYEPDLLVIKKLHRSRSSENLDAMVEEVKELADERGLQVYEYPIKYVEALLSSEEGMNKKKLSGIVAAKYPVLFNELRKEEDNLNSYYTRMFEAVALGWVSQRKRLFTQLCQPLNV